MSDRPDPWTHVPTLTGDGVRLEPLEPSHADALAANGALEASIWPWMPVRVRTIDDVRTLVAAAIQDARTGVSLPMAIVDLHAGRVVGSTRYLNLVPAQQRLEIGWTWLVPSAQRSHVNTECKRLLLDHAFGPMGCVRVEFKTDRLNTQSQTALRRLGAVEEGTFRKHTRRPDGTWRDSVYFSILDTEYPAVRERLLSRGAG